MTRPTAAPHTLTASPPTRDLGPSRPSRPFPRLPALLRDGVGYFGVSALALGVDYGLLAVLHRACGLHYLVAATLSFTAGLLVSWSLSTRFLFRNRRKLSTGSELLGFCLTGVAGLILTQVAMTALVVGLGLSAEVAKLPIAGGVFVFNFLSRRLLFSAPTTA